MPKPISASAVLRQHMPRVSRGANNYVGITREPFPTSNSFSALQEPQPVSNNSNNYRNRANSFKRKHSDPPSFADVVNNGNGSANGNVSQRDTVNEVSVNIAKVRSIMDKVADEVRNLDLDPALITVFGFLCEAVNTISDTQGKIVTNLISKSEDLGYTDPGDNEGFITVGGSFPSSDMRSLGAIPKKPRPEVSRIVNQEPDLPDRNTQRSRAASDGSDRFGQRSRAPSFSNVLSRMVPQQTSRNQVPPQTRNQVAHQRGVLPAAEPANDGPVGSKEDTDRMFRSAIRDAERSTLVFNLDMGKVPLLNKDTISRKATMALTAMAAVKDKSRNGIPSQEAVDAIDDVLGATQDMFFFGNGTSTYRHPTDKRSGSFCTVPVCYVFKDRDIRTKAEAILRAKCGINCTVPYPPTVRECIKQIVADTKKEFGNNFVRVTVDTGAMVFKVARKPPDDAADPGWKYREEDIPIPTSVRE
jgi:hypothetical protein